MTGDSLDDAAAVATPGRALHVGIVTRLDDPALELCADHLTGDTVTVVTDRTWTDELASCEVIFGNVPADWIPRLTALRWLQLESIGFESLGEQAPGILARGIEVTNLRGQFAHSAAETVLAGILGLYRGIDTLVRAREQREWVGAGVRATAELLHGKHAIVLGTGSIGLQLRRLLEAFDCDVQGFARTSGELTTLEQLDAALPGADLVVGCLPSTPQTVGLFDARRIALLHDRAVLANVGRGTLIDEDALISALIAGRLGGAVLDVSEQEPLDDASPLWSTPRTILTQHTGGGYREELLDKARRFVDNLGRFRRGEDLLNRVDWEAGY